MLQINDLYVNYGYVNALRGITFEVRENEIVSLIGSNGAGKTTSLMAISNLVEKASGTVFYKGTDITHLKSHKIVKAGISHIPEGRHVFPRLSVEDNMMMGTIGNKAMTKAMIEDKKEEMFKLFPRLKRRRQQLGATLSGGEQQMLAIARGLMSDPEMLMLDEPSLGLAPIVVEEIFELILHIKEIGKTVLLIEQNASMALSISDRGYVMENGKITISGAGSELLINPRVKKAFLGAQYDGGCSC